MRSGRSAAPELPGLLRSLRSLVTTVIDRRPGHAPFVEAPTLSSIGLSAVNSRSRFAGVIPAAARERHPDDDRTRNRHGLLASTVARGVGGTGAWTDMHPGREQCALARSRQQRYRRAEDE
jgi:hypothetical protein